MNHDDPARCRCVQCVKRIRLAYFAGPEREGQVWNPDTGKWVDAS